MATHVNASGRPNLAPLRTSSQSLDQRPPAAFRAAQAPLLSPSPISAATLPSPLYPSSFDRAIRKKDRVLLNSLSHKINPSNVSSPKSLASVEGPSPLVSKLEHASIELTKDEKPPSKSPETTQGSLGGVTERHDYRSREDYSDIKTADAYAIARSIRRNSNPAADSHPFWEEGSWEKKASHRLTLRAIVKPKAPGRQSFLIQRSLDIDELRANTSPSIGEKALLDASPLKGSRKPLPVPAKWSSNSKTQSTVCAAGSFILLVQDSCFLKVLPGRRSLILALIGNTPLPSPESPKDYVTFNGL